MEIFKLFGEVALKDTSIIKDLQTIEKESKQTSGSFDKLEKNTSEVNKELKNSSSVTSTFSGAMKLIGETAMKTSSSLLTLGKNLLNSLSGGIPNVIGINDALKSFEKTTTASGDQLNNLKGAMLDIYTMGFGESMQDVSTTMATIVQYGYQDVDVIKSMTENALLLKDAFGIDTNESIRAVDMMMKQFGTTSNESFGLLTLGMQNGLDKNGDLVDSINEYSPQFKLMGFSAEEMFQILKSGMDAGAWSIDKIGDAMKEFTILSKSGSKSTAEGMSALGLSADDMAQSFAKGGESAKNSFMIVMQKLGEMKDPVAQNAVGVQLFGTTWEDLGPKVVKAMGDTNYQLGIAGTAMDKLNEKKLDSLATTIKSIKRSFEVGIFQVIQEKVAPKLAEFRDWITAHMPTIQAIINTAMDKSETAFNKVWGVLSTYVLPALKDFYDWITPKMPAIKEAIKDAMDKSETAFNKVKNVIKDHLAPLVKQIKDDFDKYMPIIKKVVETAMDALEVAFNKAIDVAEDVIDGLKDLSDEFEKLEPVIAGVTAALIAYKVAMGIQTLITGVTTAITAAKKAWVAFTLATEGLTVAQWLLNLAMSANPIALVAIAIGVLVAIGVLLWKNWDTITKWAGILWTQIQKHFNNIKNFVGDVFNGIGKLAGTLWGIIKNNFNNIKNFISDAFTSIGNFASGAWDNIKTAFNGIINTITDVFTSLIEKASGWGSSVVSGISKGINGAIQFVKDAITNIGNAIGGTFKRLLGIASPSKVFTKYGENIVEGLAIGVQESSGMALYSIEQISNDIINMTEDSIDEQIELLERQYEETKAIYAQQEKDARYSELVKARDKADTNEDKIKAEKDINDYLITEERNAQEESINNQKTYLNKIKESIKAKEEAEKKYIDDFKDEMNDMGNAIINALKNRYEKERDLENKRLDESISNLKKQSEENMKVYKSIYDESIQYLDQQTKDSITAKQVEIDGINHLTKEEERASKQKSNADKIAKLTKEVDEAKDSDEKIKKQQELDDTLSEIQREKVLEERTLRIASLEASIKDIEANAKIRKEQFDLEYENRKQQEERLLELNLQKADQRKEASASKWEELLKQENLQMEAQYLMINNSQDDIIKLLNSYNPDWLNQGKSFGERLLEGLKLMEAPIKSQINSLLESVRSVSAITGQSTGIQQVVALGSNTSQTITAKAIPTDLQSRRQQSSGVTVNVTGNTIMNDRDADRIGQVLVSRLNNLGVSSY